MILDEVDDAVQHKATHPVRNQGPLRNLLRTLREMADAADELAALRRLDRHEPRAGDDRGYQPAA